MSQQTIQIADKPTLDDVKALLENSGYGLEALKNSLGSGGGGGNGGGVACQFSIKEDSVIVNQDEVISTLPYYFAYGSAVVLNDKIHILGGGDGKKHYKWDGSSWTSVSTLPYYFYNGSAVVLNNEIHILGGTNHYKLKKIANLITLYLQSGNKIICDTEKTGPISDNLKKSRLWI